MALSIHVKSEKNWISLYKTGLKTLITKKATPVNKEIGKLHCRFKTSIGITHDTFILINTP